MRALEAASPPDMGELRAELERRLERRLDGRAIARIERRPSAYRSSFALDELELTLDDGSRLELIFKQLGANALSPQAVRAKPRFLRRPLRELEVYESLLGDSGEWAPVCYGTAADAGRDRYWLFLERIPSRELWRVGELETWCDVARWLARMHRALGEAASTKALPSLLRYDALHYRRFAERALGLGRPSPRMAAVLQGYDRVAAQLETLPATFVHGELYASNVLVERRPGRLRVAAVDWEMAARGPALIDLAALTSGAWARSEQRAMALAYRDALEPGSGLPDDEADFLAAVELCRLQLAVQWLGWSANWTPPPEHSHDWSAEAERLVEELGL